MSTDIKVESVPQYVDEWSPEEFARRVSAFAGQIRDIHEMSKGQWYIPPEWRSKLQDFHIIRLGTLSDVKRQTYINVNKALLEQQGWKQMPAGVVNNLFPHDQGLGVYMGLPRPAFRQWQAVRDEMMKLSRQSLQAQRRKDIADKLEHADAGPRFHVDKFEVTQTTTTVADLLGESADKAKRRK